LYKSVGYLGANLFLDGIGEVGNNLHPSKTPHQDWWVVFGGTTLVFWMILTFIDDFHIT
jgi:hypothetical protein